MANYKNARGGPSDEDPRPLPRLTTQEKVKAKKTTTKKRKLVDMETKRAAAVAADTKRAERGGAQSGVRIADQLSPTQRAAVERVESLHGSLARTVMLGGWRIAIDESQPLGRLLSSRHSQ